MMEFCKQCRAPIPSGQRFCSMCYGDPHYGRDGYYLAQLERDALLQQEREQEEEQWERDYGDGEDE